MRVASSGRSAQGRVATLRSVIILLAYYSVYLLLWKKRNLCSDSAHNQSGRSFRFAVFGIFQALRRPGDGDFAAVREGARLQPPISKHARERLRSG